MIAFDRTNRSPLARWWWTIDQKIYLSLILLCIAGVIMIIAASPSVARRIGKPEDYFIIRQVFFLGAGVCIFTALSALNHVAVRRLAIVGLGISILMLVMVFFLGFEVKGARRWISILGVSIQPSEFIKPFFAVAGSYFMARKHTEAGYPGYMIASAMFAIVILLVGTQPDLGMSIIIGLIWLTQMFIAGMQMFWLFAAGLILMGGLYLAYLTMPHVTQRVEKFINPATTENYQVEKALEAFKRGGLFGVGPGEGKVKIVLPDAHTDFVFPVLAEEFGVIACILIAALFAVIVLRALWHAQKEEDIFTLLAITGIATGFGAQALVNIGVSIHMLPTKGMTLPFLSYGGSSTLALATSMGMLLALTKRRFV